MQVNLHDAKTHRSRYVDQALSGEEVVIARAGKPRVRFTADLKADFQAEIETMFHGR